MSPLLEVYHIQQLYMIYSYCKKTMKDPTKRMDLIVGKGRVHFNSAVQYTNEEQRGGPVNDVECSELR